MSKEFLYKNVYNKTPEEVKEKYTNDKLRNSERQNALLNPEVFLTSEQKLNELYVKKKVKELDYLLSTKEGKSFIASISENSENNHPDLKLLEEEISPDSNSYELSSSDKADLLDLKERFSLEEAKFHAFLNIEFNILNRKLMSCSKYCYSNTEKTYQQAYTCINNCKKTIKSAKKFTEEVEQSLISQHATCLEEIKLPSIEDQNKRFISCYDKLIVNMEEAKKNLKSEFQFYV